MKTQYSIPFVKKNIGRPLIALFIHNIGLYERNYYVVDFKNVRGTIIISIADLSYRSLARKRKVHIRCASSLNQYCLPIALEKQVTITPSNRRIAFNLI